MIIALAGVRMDSADVIKPRLPPGNVNLVRTRIRWIFETERATALVSSAACGADLIALLEAEQLGLRRRVILPFERDRFRETCVTDRAGEWWGQAFDRVLDIVSVKGDLVILHNEPNGEAYSVANRAILDQAMELAREDRQPATAVLIWDGVSRGQHDLTDEFGVEAQKRGLRVIEVITL
jgi:hypothetical protein